MDDVTVHEVVPGEFEVRTPAGVRHHVVVPAGVGVPGVDDADLAVAVIVELVTRTGGDVPEVVDVSALFGADPGLFAAVEARLEADAGA